MEHTVAVKFLRDKGCARTGDIESYPDAVANYLVESGFAEYVPTDDTPDTDTSIVAGKDFEDDEEFKD